MQRHQRAQHTVAMLGLWGLLAAVVGGGIVVGQWPRGDDGTSIWWDLGLLVLGLGLLTVLVAVIAWGVRLGIDWSGLSDLTSAPAPAARRSPRD